MYKLNLRWVTGPEQEAEWGGALLAAAERSNQDQHHLWMDNIFALLHHLIIIIIIIFLNTWCLNLLIFIKHVHIRSHSRPSLWSMSQSYFSSPGLFAECAASFPRHVFSFWRKCTVNIRQADTERGFAAINHHHNHNHNCHTFVLIIQAVILDGKEMNVWWTFHLVQHVEYVSQENNMFRAL